MTFQHEEGRVRGASGSNISDIDLHSEFPPTQYVHSARHICPIEIDEICPPRLESVPIRFHQCPCPFEPVAAELLSVWDPIGALISPRNPNSRDSVHRVALDPPDRLDECINSGYRF